MYRIFYRNLASGSFYGATRKLSGRRSSYGKMIVTIVLRREMNRFNLPEGKRAKRALAEIRNPKSLYRTLILSNFFALLILLSSLSNAYCKGTELKLRTSQFLKQLTTTRNQGMGGSSVASCEDESLHDNPAGLAFSSCSQTDLSLLRFPKTTAYVMFPSAIENVGNETHYVSNAYSIESIRYSTLLEQFGAIGIDVVLSQTGKFSRVNPEGKVINEFPENDLAIAFGYAKKLYNTAFGIDANFIRPKALDQEGEKTFVRGFVYDIGLIQKAGNFKIGIVLKNISNGLSRPTNSSPISRFELKNSFYLGAAYHYVPLKDVELLFELDVNPPFKHGFRGNLGSELRYRNWLNLRIGYVRDVSDAFIPDDETDADETRYFKLDPLERIEGLTYGVGLKTGKLRFDLACTPGYKLRYTSSKDFKLFMDDNDCSFSLSASYGF